MKTNLTTVLSALFLVLLIVATAKAQNGNNSATSSNKSEKKSGEQVKDRPLKITKKSSPRTDGNCSDETGNATVKVTFHSSGKVTDAEIILFSSCEYFNRQTLEAARKIKFEPQIKNGEPVTVTKIIEYKFRKL